MTGTSAKGYVIPVDREEVMRLLRAFESARLDIITM
jgi:hypothetical protein